MPVFWIDAMTRSEKFGLYLWVSIYISAAALAISDHIVNPDCNRCSVVLDDHACLITVLADQSGSKTKSVRCEAETLTVQKIAKEIAKLQARLTSEQQRQQNFRSQGEAAQRQNVKLIIQDLLRDTQR